MTTSEPLDPPVCDATPIRHFALIGQFDLLATLTGGVVKVPRTVFDPEEDPNGIEALLSEIGRSERYWATRSGAPDRTEKWHRLRALRSRDDIEILDLRDEELETFAEVQTPSYARTLGYAAPLDPGEAAVVAIAENRELDAVIDDAQGRAAFAERVPHQTVSTSRELLRAGVTREVLTSPEAEVVYMDLREGRLSGPDSLWE